MPHLFESRNQSWSNTKTKSCPPSKCLRLFSNKQTAYYLTKWCFLLWFWSPTDTYGGKYFWFIRSHIQSNNFYSFKHILSATFALKLTCFSLFDTYTKPICKEQNCLFVCRGKYVVLSKGKHVYLFEEEKSVSIAFYLEMRSPPKLPSNPR